MPRPSRLVLHFSVLAAVLAALLASPAIAADDTNAAREHYQRGTALYDLGKYQDAIKEFEAAYQAKPDPALLYNLAQAHRLSGNHDQALHFYRTYLRRVPKAANRSEIESRIEALEKLVAQKKETTTPPNQTIPPGVGDQGQAIAPPPASTEPAGQTPAAPPGPPAVPPPPPPTETLPGGAAPATPQAESAQSSGARLKRIGLYTAAGGVALVAVGAVFGLRARGAASDLEDTAARGGVFDPSVEERGQNAETIQAVATIAGLVAVAAGAGLYYFGHRKERAASVAVVPTASAHQAGALVEVTF